MVRKSKENDILRPLFWEKNSLNELSDREWEALCDGCGKCCLNKLIDEDSEELYFTYVACRGLDCATGKCSVYERRKEVVPECLIIRPDTIKEVEKWLPASCAYKRLYKGRSLPSWHPLVSGDTLTVERAGMSVKGRVVSETKIADEDLPDHLARWPELDKE